MCAARFGVYGVVGSGRGQGFRPFSHVLEREHLAAAGVEDAVQLVGARPDVDDRGRCGERQRVREQHHAGIHGEEGPVRKRCSSKSKWI